MHPFAHRRHSRSGESPAQATQGRILEGGWRYDLKIWLLDTFVVRGKLRELRRRIIELARLRPGEHVLDVGCGTGTLAIAARQAIGPTGRVVGIDPGMKQIARARSKAARCNMPVNFHIGVIERLAFPDKTFDVAFSTLMMHHLPPDLKRQGLSEMTRVLKPEGRLVIADFKRPKDRPNHAQHSDADLPALVREVGFSRVETVEVRLRHRHGSATATKVVGVAIGGRAIKLITLMAGAALLWGAPRLATVSKVFFLFAGAHLVGLALVLGSVCGFGRRAIMRRRRRGAEAESDATLPRVHGSQGQPTLLRHINDDAVEILTARGRPAVG